MRTVGRPYAAKPRAAACSELRCSLEKEMGRPSPSSLGEGRTPREGRSADAPRRSSGVAEAARGDRNALNTGDLVRGVGGAHRPATKPARRGRRPCEESDEAVVLTKTMNVVGGKGLYVRA